MTGVAQPVFDLHSDVAVDVHRRRAAGERRVLSTRHLEAWQSGGIRGFVCVVGGDPTCYAPGGSGSAPQMARRLIEEIEEEAAESEGQLGIVRTSAELEQAIEADRIALIFGLEGSSPLGAALEHLDDLFESGVRVLGLTWNRSNTLAGGCMDRGGLTALGARAVGELEDRGMVIDAAHASEETLDDLLRLGRRPILVSHANSKALHRHPRNLTDRQLREVAEAGGLIGAVAFPAYVGDEAADLLALVRHISRMVEVAGDRGVGIGADFIDYQFNAVMAELVADGYEIGDPRAMLLAGLEGADRLQGLAAALREGGLSEATVHRVCWENPISFLSSALPR